MKSETFGEARERLVSEAYALEKRILSPDRPILMRLLFLLFCGRFRRLRRKLESPPMVVDEDKLRVAIRALKKEIER